MMYPMKLGEVLDVSQSFCTKSRTYLGQLAKRHLRIYNKITKGLTEKRTREQYLEVMIMELRSQEVRTLAPENDPLKMGMGWKVDDLAKPQIMVESTFGDSHPGSAHLDQFVKEAVQAVNTHGGKAARYFATDMCDGIAQGHDGINYSLPHRDAIVNLVEAQANASVYDGGVFIASCDKSVPAMLMSMGMPLPKHVYGHGWLVIDGGKMSKSKGNVVDPYALSEMFGVDALRFFLLRTFPFGSDGNFSNELLIGTINTDLANKLGNLVSRTTGMAEKYFGGKLPVQREDAPEDCELKKMACALRDRYQAEMDKLQLQNGLDEVFKVIDRANKYIDETAPWALGKDESKRERLTAVLYNLLETIRICTTLLLPVMPDTCDKIFAKLGADEACRSWDNANVWGVLPAGAQISKGENLFPRIDVDEALAKLDELQEQQKKAALPAVELEPYVEDEVDLDTFLKSDFRAVKIKNCEAVKKSDKLLKFTLDDGSGTDRIILSGIHQYYEPEQLIGKTAIAILNLPPRKMMGIPSCGMLISAVHKEKGEEKLHLMLIDDSVPAGAKLC